MSLKARIEADFKEALKARDSLKVSCLRLIKAAIKNKEIDLRGELQEGQLVSLLATLSKQRKEAIDLYKQGGRNDLAEKESRELALIEGYLPMALPEEELTTMIDVAIAETGAKGSADMGKVMKALMPKLSGRADGKVVSEMVKNKLVR